MNIEDLKRDLENTFAGRPWYGKNIQSTLNDIPIGKLLLRLEGSYNMAELVHHMIAWRNYTIRLLETGRHHPVPDYENFPTIMVMMQEEWTDLLERFEESQRHLVMLLADKTIDLDALVPEKPYSFREVLQGIIDHDIYHAGQLNLLAKFL